ncbi:16S rRNA (guanine(527)-N(7))-methyltransferase RsmG [Duganella sp. BJB488]|uniref:16S rRNA (guanine(527)-N(7))-methyltransferase RsmG n=1 Tax=Duganella TaxID=75654 RepID=UPI000E350BB4|nr:MULTISPECIES: 16S rRNA (guanine(527)-N(7))-methyltransferase RsmG [unclassified Duganella]RFP24449.1 16S rRNA (guanine(527)-N(7))-methyltransferase RsmG [Duganella sp. BJB489]RFP26810.1 16S rRNA (guanine(527)-N(7))-methyltransferase RsmG [Duganella sp. BJB488]RFP34457.1 16S rRNA (guanine(527)-N(7))-methyltransferase RsmG [Duganella sp. BJB480]
MKVFDRAVLADVLKQGINSLKLDLGDDQVEKLLDYLALLNKWNAVYNLTSVRDPMQMVTLHVLDSLAAVPAFAGASNVLDVGAGGGLPGMVLAISRPDMKVSMIDTVHKKTAFLNQVKAELGLANVTVYTKRVEQLEVKTKFDVITSRAFADLSDFVNWSGHLLQEGGRFIALKGTAPAEERERLPEPWKVQKLEPLEVPGLDAERHLVFIQAETK